MFFCSNFFPIFYCTFIRCFASSFSSSIRPFFILCNIDLLFWWKKLEKVYCDVVVLYVCCVCKCVYFVYLSTVLSQRPKFSQYFLNNIFCSTSSKNVAFISYPTIVVASFGQTSNRLLI